MCGRRSGGKLLLNSKTRSAKQVPVIKKAQPHALKRLHESFFTKEGT